MTKIAGFRSGSESGSISQRHRFADLGSGCTPNSHGIRNIGTGNKEQWGGTRLQMYPTAYWKVQEDDTPARTVKTIVHTLVKVRFRLRQHLPIVCSSVSDPDWILIQSGQWIRIRILEGKNYPQY